MRIVLPLLVGLAALAGAAETLAPGAPMPALRLADQHDVSATIDADVRLVLFTRDMDGADVVKEALAENGAALLQSAHAVYVADIAAMPGIITRLFALPAMRKRPYRLLLDRDGAPTAALPSKAGEVTVIALADGTIQRVDYVDSAAALRALLQAPATPAP